MQGVVMQPSNVLTMLPPSVRRAIYMVYGLLSLITTAAMAAFTALPQYEVPAWLVAALAVLGALAAPVSVVAASNTQVSAGTPAVDPALGNA
jgi:hypothetical protein